MEPRQFWMGSLRLSLTGSPVSVTPAEDDGPAIVDLEAASASGIDRLEPTEAINWLWFDAVRHLMLGDPRGLDAYCAIRRAMSAQGMLSGRRTLLAHRERLPARNREVTVVAVRYEEDLDDVDGLAGEAGPSAPAHALMAVLVESVDEDAPPEDPLEPQVIDVVEETRRRPRRRKNAAATPDADNVVSIAAARRGAPLRGNGRRRADPKP